MQKELILIPKQLFALVLFSRLHSVTIISPLARRDEGYSRVGIINAIELGPG